MGKRHWRLVGPFTSRRLLGAPLAAGSSECMPAPPAPSSSGSVSWCDKMSGSASNDCTRRAGRVPSCDCSRVPRRCGRPRWMGSVAPVALSGASSVLPPAPPSSAALPRWRARRRGPCRPRRCRRCSQIATAAEAAAASTATRMRVAARLAGMPHCVDSEAAEELGPVPLFGLVLEARFDSWRSDRWNEGWKDWRTHDGSRAATSLSDGVVMSAGTDRYLQTMAGGDQASAVASQHTVSCTGGRTVLQSSVRRQLCTTGLGYCLARRSDAHPCGGRIRTRIGTRAAALACAAATGSSAWAATPVDRPATYIVLKEGQFSSGGSVPVSSSF